MDSSPRRPRRFSRWQTTKRTFVLGGVPIRGEKKEKVTEEVEKSQVLEERIYKDPLGFHEATDVLQSSKTKNSQDADDTRHIPVMENSEEESNHSSKENSEIDLRNAVQSKRKRNISVHDSILRKREKNVETVKRGNERKRENKLDLKNGETSDSDLSLTGKPSLRDRNLLSTSSGSLQSRQYSSVKASCRLKSTKKISKKRQSKDKSKFENKALFSEKDNSLTSSYNDELHNSRISERNQGDISSSPSKQKQKSRKRSSSSGEGGQKIVNGPQNGKASLPRKNKNETMSSEKSQQNKSALQPGEVKCSNTFDENLDTSNIRCQSLRKRNSIASPVSKQYPLEFYSNKVRSSIEKKNEKSKISEQKKLSKKALVTEKGNASSSVDTSKIRETESLEKNSLQDPSQSFVLKSQQIPSVKKRSGQKEKTEKHELTLNLPKQRVHASKTMQQHSGQKNRASNFDESGITAMSETTSVLKTSEFRKDLSFKKLKNNSQIDNHKTKSKASTHSLLKEKETSRKITDMSEPKKRKTNDSNFSEASSGNSNLRNRGSLRSPTVVQLQRQYPEKYLSPKKSSQHLYKEKKDTSLVQGKNDSDLNVQLKKVQSNKTSVNKHAAKSNTNRKDDEKELKRPKKTYSLPRKKTASNHVISRNEPKDQGNFLLMKPQFSMTIDAQNKSISSDYRRLKQSQKPTASVDETVLRSPRKAQKRKLVEDLEVVEKFRKHAEKQEVVLWCESGQTRSGVDITAYDIVLDSLLDVETSLLESEADPFCQRVIKRVLGGVEKNIKSVISKTVATKDLQADLRKRKSRCSKLAKEIQEEEQMKTKCHSELHVLASKRRDSDLHEISKWMQEYSRLMTTTPTP